MIKNKTIKSIFFCGIFVLLVIIINVVFPKKEITIEERLSYLLNEYYKEKGKYDCTLELINKIDYNHPISIAVALSQKQIPYELFDETIDESIKNTFPFF